MAFKIPEPEIYFFFNRLNPRDPKWIEGGVEMVKVGCLREMSETFLLLEAVILEIEGVTAAREIDPALGLALLRV